MIVISDTTPLRYLIEIGVESILANLFSKIIIPTAVFGELQRHKTPQPVRDWITNHPSWLIVQQADLSLYIPQKRIGDGEREAFALALELNADAVLLDDKGAMTEAKRLNLTVIRTFDLLERAAEQGLIDLSVTIDRMKLTTFRLPTTEIIEAMLERDRQRKQDNQYERKNI